ncbi:MAG: histidinol-phosphate aminotransferase family protein [Bacteroidetes bacterium]|nr:histidinol-phosphate aminotransferase family protein [Bacteroidota bacterium]
MNAGITHTEEEKLLAHKINELKKQAGSHSPSVFTLKQKLPELNIKIDACFLSNPYATDLFLSYFTREIINTGKIRDLLEFYPSQNQVISEILAPFLNVNHQNIFIGNGAIEIIQAVIHNFTQKKIIINIPTFSSYYEFVKDDVEIIYNTLEKESGYRLDIEKFLGLIKEHNPDTIVLINPNNPDGNYIVTADIQKILESVRDVKTVIIDESFIHFAYENNNFEPISTAELINKFPNLVLIKSMSKDFGIAGIRAGYAVMNKERVDKLLKSGFLWNSNGFSEYFFRLYTRADFAYDYNSVRIRYIMETIEFVKQLETINAIKVYPGRANFVLIELPELMKSIDFVTDVLIKYGIYIRTCEDKIGLQGEYIRLASRTKKENDYIFESLKSYFNP